MKASLLLALAVVLPIESSDGRVHRSGTPIERDPENPPPASAASRSAPFLLSLFSPDSVPVASIPVLANALGDVVQDGSLNLLDLLRIRDITIARPPSPTSYELAESDLNVDGSVSAADLDVIRDILLRKTGVPYLVGSTGGNVLGDGITLTFPPNALEGTVVISVERYGESEFAAATGVDTKGAAQDSAYFMAGFEIKSNTIGFKLPVGVTITLDSMPPCAYQGLNGLFAVVPDRDGDGLTDLFLINELKVSGDSLTVTAGDIPVPSIESLSLSAVEPGQPLYITGHGFGNDWESVVLRFQSALSDTSRLVRPSVCEDSTIIVTVPDVPVGPAMLTLENVLTGLTSNAVILQINTLSGAVSDIRSTIVGFYMGIAATLDSMSIDTLVSDFEDTTVRSYLRGELQLQRASVDSEIVYYSLLPVSELETWRSFAAFILNLEQGTRMEMVYRAAGGSSLDPCAVCNQIWRRMMALFARIEAGRRRYWKLALECTVKREKTPPECLPCVRAEQARQSILRDTDTEAALARLFKKCVCFNKCADTKGIQCDACPKTVAVGYGPQGMKAMAGYNPGGGFSTSGCCLNIIRYKRNPCITVVRHLREHYGPPVPVEPDPGLRCPPTAQPQDVFSKLSADGARPHPGSIIKVTNAPVPYNIVGILNDNGHAFIPQVPMNTRVTYSMYDPVTGFYDPDVGTYTTGAEPGGFDWPLLLFQPNTQIKTCLLKSGEPAHDSVSVDLQRIDYLLAVEAADTAKLFNVGFSASAHLSLKIEDPQGGLLFDNTDVACYATAHVRLVKVGTYRIRVALGVVAQSGSFDLGVSYSPDRPIAVNCLCGTILADSLFYELSPYDVRCSATIPASDTLRTEAGVTIQFEPGAAVTATGALTGAGSPERPVKLKHAGSPGMGPATARRAVSGRKEVQP